MSNFFSHSILEEIKKAISFIKVDQFHSGFPEIADPERGGNIEVVIERDSVNKELFHVMFSFLSTPGNSPIYQQKREISHSELRRLANEYDKNKERIDAELERRDEVSKLLAL